MVSLLIQMQGYGVLAKYFPFDQFLNDFVFRYLGRTTTLRQIGGENLYRFFADGGSVNEGYHIARINPGFSGGVFLATLLTGRKSHCTDDCGSQFIEGHGLDFPVVVVQGESWP